MSKTAISPETLQQFEEIFAATVTNAHGRLYDQAVKEAYDGIALLNRTVGCEEKAGAGPLFLLCGRALSRLADHLPGGVNYHARCALSSVACNYLMLAREIFVEENLTDDAEVAMQAAYQSVFNIGHEKRFPVPTTIFGYFRIFEYCVPELYCDLDKAVALLVERHKDLAERRIELCSNASLCEQLMQQAESLVNACDYLYANRGNVHLIFCRADMLTPVEIKQAREAIVFARYYAELGDLTLTMENINRSRRACQISSLILARVKALMAMLYVKFWQKSSAYEFFALLAHQAMAFSQHCLDQRWRCVQGITENCHQQLSAADVLKVQTLCDCANVAFTYAACFHAHMQYSHGVHNLDVAPSEYEFQPPLSFDQARSGLLTMPVALEFDVRYVRKDRLD